MFTFRQFLIAIAGLWVLCCIQSQVHPKKYIDYSSHSNSASSAPHKIGADHSLAKAASATLGHIVVCAVLDADGEFARNRATYYSPTSLFEAKPKLYRIFPTGLSPPASLSHFS